MPFGRLSHAWKPDRATSSTSRSQLTDQMWRCLAMKANPMSSPRARKSGRFLRDMSHPARSRAISFFRAAISGTSAPICPFAGNAAAGAAIGSRIQRCKTLSARSRSRAACATETPRSVTGFTASVLDWRLNFRLVIGGLRSLGHDLSPVPFVSSPRFGLDDPGNWLSARLPRCSMTVTVTQGAADVMRFRARHQSQQGRRDSRRAGLKEGGLRPRTPCDFCRRAGMAPDARRHACVL